MFKRAILLLIDGLSYVHYFSLSCFDRHPSCGYIINCIVIIFFSIFEPAVVLITILQAVLKLWFQQGDRIEQSSQKSFTDLHHPVLDITDRLNSSVFQNFFIFYFFCVLFYPFSPEADLNVKHLTSCTCAGICVSLSRYNDQFHPQAYLFPTYAS